MNRALLFVVGFLIALIPQTAFAFYPCTDAAYMRRIDTRLTPGECDVIATTQIRWSGHSANMRLVKPHGAELGDPAALTARVNELAGRIGSAMDQMGSVSIGEVTVMLTGLDSPGAASARDDGEIPDEIQGRASDYGAECPVAIYKQREGMTPNEFMFVYGHEIFHCVQFTMWDRQMFARDNTARWWKEGTAEYFGHLVRPSLTVGDSYIHDFDNLITHSSMTDYEYETVAFFAWLGQTHGPDAIPPFIGAVPSGAETALPPDMWMEFAQAYLDRSIRLPGGRELPSSPLPGATINISGTDNFALPAVPYTVASSTFVFQRGHFYHITYDNQPADARMRWKKAAGGAWGDALTEVSTCDGEQRYKVVWTTTHSSTAGQIHITAEEEGADRCACPGGSWQETEDSIRRASTRWSHANINDWLYKAGGVRVDFNPDHTGALTYQDLQSEVGRGSEVWTEQTESGASQFTWRTMGDQLYTILVRGGQSVKIHTVMHAPGGSFTNDQRVAAQTISGHYYCDGEGLHIELPSAGEYQWDFTRLSRPPRP